MSDSLPRRLRENCIGHPNARIPWPHRILHEAAEEIERLQKLVDLACPNCGESEHYYPTAIPRKWPDISDLIITDGGHCLHCGHEQEILNKNDSTKESQDG